MLSRLLMSERLGRERVSVSDMNEAPEPTPSATGIGTFTPPPGLTREDCERLAKEADEKRERENA